MKNFPPELIVKAKAAKSAEELLALAKANNVELTEEEAKTYFAQLNANSALSDEELDVVAGGCGEDEDTFEPGEVVELKMTCSDCKCILGIYQQEDNRGGCIVTCMKCGRPIWIDKTHDGIAKAYQGGVL